MEKISASQAAQLLGIPIENLGVLEKQGLIHAIGNAKGINSYSREEIIKIKSRHNSTLSDEAIKVDSQIRREESNYVSRLIKSNKRFTILSAAVLSCLFLLLSTFSFLFYKYPLQTSNFFGYYYRFNVNKQQARLTNPKGPSVLAAQTGPGVITATQQTTVLADVFKPIAAVSLEAVKVVDDQKYLQIVTNPAAAAGTTSQAIIPGAAGTNGTAGAPGTTGAQGPVGSGGTNGTNGTNGANGADGTSVADVLTSPGSIIIRNGSNVTAALNAGLNGQVLTITGGIPAWTNSSTQSAFSNLTSGVNTTASMVVGSGASLSATGSGTITANSFSGIIPVANGGTGLSTLSLNGVLFGNGTGIIQTTSAPASGQLLLGNAGGVPTFTSLTGDATITGGGVLTLKNTGTAGTYGSALNIPVLTTDAQGRITGVTNTTIAGLTTANFSSANISQWTNDANYITPSSNNTLTNKSLSGTTNTFSNIPNSALTNSSLTVTAGTGLSGGGLVSLGGTVTLSLPNVGTAGTYGNATTIPVVTTDAQGRVSGVVATAISGLTAANLAAGDFSSKINSGTYSINISGNAATATTTTNFTGALSGDVSGTQTTTSVDKIKGAVLGATTATAGNLLIGSGTQWVTKSLSNDATIDSNGVLTLKNTGTAGTYGSALNIPVLTTDAQGRVTGVTNTAISGLTTSNLSATAGITNAQLANSSITVNTTSPLSGGGALSLGGTLTLSCPTCITSGGTLFTAVATSGSNSSISLGGTLTLAAGTNITTTNNGTGTVTFATVANPTFSGLVTASNGLTLTTGALNLTATSGTLSLSGLSASSINTGVNNLTFTSGNFNTTATGINSTAIGATTPSTGAFTTINGQSETLSNTTNQLVFGTTNTTTISSLAPAANRTATIPALSASDTFDFLNQAQTLTNKTIAAVSNTISGLTNANLSGTAGITNANLANSSLTVSAGTGLSGGGSVSLGGTTTLSLPNVGTAGTYGSALNIPVFTTDAQGRVTNVTNTAIAGLTNGNLSGAAGITNANLANSAITINTNGILTGGATVSLGGTIGLTATEADTLASVTGRGATTATALTLSNAANSITAGTLTATGGTINGTTIGATTPSTGAFTTLSSTGTTNLGQGTGVVTLNSSGALNLTGAAASTLTTGANTLTLTSSNFNVASTGVVTLKGGQTVDLTTPAATGLTIDSGTTGALNFGTSANAKTITIGNATGATAVDINSGTGNINLQAAGTGTTGNIQIGAGGAGSGTPDLLVLDNKNTAGDPTGTNGAMYYNSNTGKFRCYQNSTWKDCIHNPSVDSVNDTSITSPTPGTYPTLGTAVEIMTPTNPTLTPSSTTSRILVTGAVYYSNPAAGEDTNAEIQVSVRRGSGSCAGTLVGTSLVDLISDPVQSHYIPFTYIDSPATTAAQAYTVCAAMADSNGAAATNATIPQVMLTIEEISASGADLAELYSTTDSSIGPGDVVMLDPSAQKGVLKTSGAYSKTALGVISTSPGLLMDDGVSGDNLVPVALSGRIPVKVSTENGAIQAGDYLTSSSLPGVAMKATKAGPVIGQALADYNEQTEGLVLTFVKNGYFNGSMPDFASTSTNSQLLGQDILTNLINQPSSTSSAGSVDLSEIFTDRVVAGLEIVTPKLTAQNILATGALSMIDKNGLETVTIDASGDAMFNGTLTADTIKANHIEGLDLLVDNLNFTKNGDTSTDSAQTTNAVTNTPTSMLDEVTQIVSGMFRNAVDFFGNVIFHGDVLFAGRPTFNSDTAGHALIKAGATEVDISFTREYSQTPVITASVNLTGGVSLSDLPSYAVYDSSMQGFKIKLSRAASADLYFSWVALATNGDNVSTGSSNTESPAVVNPTPTPSPTPAQEQITPNPTDTPTPTPTEISSPPASTSATQ